MARYQGAVWRGPVPNTYGPGVALRPRLIVAHVTQGSDLDGTDSWFHDPTAQVSAHFGVKRSGEVYQWVDTSEVAWAQCAYNDVAISIEHEGFSGQPLSAAQGAASLRLMHWISHTHGIPLRRTANPAGTGVIGHGELGVAGCDHPDCPGAPILHQLGAALATTDRPSPAKRKEPPVSLIPTNVKQRQALASNARQGGAGALIGLALAGALPNVAGVNKTVEWAIMIGGGVLLFVVEHFVGDPTTGTGAPPTA